MESLEFLFFQPGSLGLMFWTVKLSKPSVEGNEIRILYEYQMFLRLVDVPDKIPIPWREHGSGP